MGGTARVRTTDGARGRTRRKFALILVVLAAIGCVLVGAAVQAPAAGQASLTTDKSDYTPGEVVHISGTGFVPGDEYAVPVKRPDGSIVLIDPVEHTATQGWGAATADATGNLTYDYQLNGVAGVYEARAYPANWSGEWSETPIASVTFTDASANLDQCTNGGVGDTPEPCKGSNGSEIDGFKNWVNGNVNDTKAHWREGEFLSYRDTISIDVAGTHVFQIHYDTVRSGKHAIDYLGSFDATETTSSTGSTFHANNNNPCADKLPAANCSPSSPADSFPVPAATLVNCATSTGTPPASQVSGSFKIFGANSPDITAVNYVSQNVVSGAGQCSTSIAITFTTSGAGTVVLAWGGHVASESDWGAGNSASFISGSPYHMAQDSLKSNGVNQNGVGSQDRALAASAVVFTPSITTDVKDSNGSSVTNGSVPIGTTVHDTATLSGASSNAGGTVTYKRFSTIDCTGGSTDQNVTVTNGNVPNSANFTPTTPGSYSYRAVYSGNNGPPQNLGATAPCEPFTINKATPGISTTVKDANGATVDNDANKAALGTTVHDTATLSGQVGSLSLNGAATVTYSFFETGDCSGTAVSTEDKTVAANGTVPDSSPNGPLGAGDYSYQATYNGNANYSSKTGACEPFTITKGDTLTATQIHDSDHNEVLSVGLGSTVHDRAAVSGKVGSITPGGNVSFTFYENDKCEGTGNAAGTVAVDSSGVAHPSDDQGPLAAGGFSFKATYSGDDNYKGSTSDCEPLSVVCQIAFASMRTGTGDIYLMDGNTQMRITTSPAFDGEPALFSPSGKVAFASNRPGNSEIYSMRARGTAPTRLTSDPAVDTEPSWSPDGKKIAFASKRTGDGDIYVMNADGTDQRRLTTNAAADSSPAWSPDGNKLAFASSQTGNGDIYVMNVDGTDQRRLTTNAAVDSSPDWSPDGSKIAFASKRTGNGDIYVINGSAQTRLTTSAAVDGEPSFSQHAKVAGKIDFVSNRNGDPDIYALNATGAQWRLTMNPARDSSPDAP